MKTCLLSRDNDRNVMFMMLPDDVALPGNLVNVEVKYREGKEKIEYEVVAVYELAG